MMRDFLRARSRGPALVSLLLPLCLSPVAASGQDVGAEIQDLKERIATLEEKLASTPAGGGLTAGIDKRPYLQSTDGKFRVEFGGRLQARYTYQARDVNRSSRDGSDRSFFELERARVRMEGHLINPRFKFRVEWDGHTDGENLGLTDAYLETTFYKSDDGVHSAKLSAGQWKPHFGRQEKQSSAQQLLVDRSLANEFFNIDRNIGLWFNTASKLNEDGLFNGIYTEAGITNGFDSVNKSPGDDEFDHIPAFIFHVDIDVMGNMGKYALAAGDYNRRDEPGLTVGASFASDANNGSGGVDSDFLQYKVYQMAYDAVFKYQGFNVNLEYFGRWLDMKGSDVADDPATGDGEGGGDGSALYSHGGYVEAGYMIPDTSLQIVGRASAVWNREGKAKGNAVEAGGGFNYFFNNHNMKWSGDVLFLDIPSGMLPITERLPGHTDASTPATPDGYQFQSFSSSSTNLGEFQGVMFRTQLQLYF